MVSVKQRSIIHKDNLIAMFKNFKKEEIKVGNSFAK
jgi:hypothetical protein